MSVLSVSIETSDWFIWVLVVKGRGDDTTR